MTNKTVSVFNLFCYSDNNASKPSRLLDSNASFCQLQQSDEKPKAHLEDFKHRLQTVVQGKEELRRQLEQQEKQISELKDEVKEKSARQRLMEKATEEMESINEELSEKVNIFIRYHWMKKFL